MCSQVWCPIFGNLNLTHQSAHTQLWVVNKHIHIVGSGQPCAAAPGEQLGVLVPCSRVSANSQIIEWVLKMKESAGHSLPPPTIPAGTKTWTRDLWVTSPNLEQSEL